MHNNEDKDIAKNVLIHNSQEDFSFITESANDRALPPGCLMYLEGTFATMGKKNENRHMYEYNNYESVLQRLYPKIAKKSLFGETEHVKKRIVDMNRISHRIEKIQYEEASQQYKGGIMIMDTDIGRDKLYPIAAAGSPIFVSSRAIGDVNFRTGIVKLNYMVTFDATAEPGFDEAEFQPSEQRIVTESFVFESLDESPLWVPKHYFMGGGHGGKNVAGADIVESNDATQNKKEKVEELSTQNTDEMTKEEVQGMVEETMAKMVSEGKYVTADQMADGVSKYAQENLIPEMQKMALETMQKGGLSEEAMQKADETIKEKAEEYVSESLQRNKVMTASVLDKYHQDVLLPTVKSIATKAATFVLEAKQVVSKVDIDNYIAKELAKSGRKAGFVTESKCEEGTRIVLEDGRKGTVSAIHESDNTMTVELDKNLDESDEDNLVEMDMDETYEIEGAENDGQDIVATIDGYNQDVLVPEIQKMVNESLNRFIATLDGYHKDELKPAMQQMVLESLGGKNVSENFEEFLGKFGSAKLEKMVTESKQQTLETIDQYIQTELVPEMKKMVLESMDMPAVQEMVMPEVDKEYTLNDDVETRETQPLFAGTTFKVLEFNDEMVKIQPLDAQGSEHGMTLSMAMFQENASEFVNESFDNGGTDNFLHSLDANINKAKLTAQDALVAGKRSEEDLDYVNESFRVHMPQKIQATWAGLPQNSKDLIASQAKQRNLNNKAAVESFLNSRDWNALKTGKSINQEARTQLASERYKRALKASIL